MRLINVNWAATTVVAALHDLGPTHLRASATLVQPSYASDSDRCWLIFLPAANTRLAQRSSSDPGLGTIPRSLELQHMHIWPRPPPAQRASAQRPAARRLARLSEAPQRRRLILRKTSSAKLASIASMGKCGVAHIAGRRLMLETMALEEAPIKTTCW